MKVEQRKPTQEEYLEALRNYYLKSEGHADLRHLDHKIEHDQKIIDAYEKLNDPQIAKLKIVLKIIGSLISAIIYAILFLYVLREVFNLSTDFTIKNVFLITALMVAYNMKFRLA